MPEMNPAMQYCSRTAFAGEGRLVKKRCCGVGSAGALCFGGVGLLTTSRAQKIESAGGLMDCDDAHVDFLRSVLPTSGLPW
jgi:hypothetical protein